MSVIGAAVFGALFCAVVSATVKVEHRVAFFGEDVHINVLKRNDSEVVFKPRTDPNQEVFIMHAGMPANKSKVQLISHDLVLRDVQEEDEGMYIIRYSREPGRVRHYSLSVKDCNLEQAVKYGATFHIQLKDIEGPISLEFRPNLVQVNQTYVPHTSEPPPVLLYNQTTVLGEDFVGRLSVSEKRVTLHSVRMTDEGSFTVLDSKGQIKIKNCLNVKDLQIFLRPTQGENLKTSLYLHHSNVSVVYRHKSDSQERAIISQGVLVTPLDSRLDGRLEVEGSDLILKKVETADTGYFKVTDQAGLPVAHIHIHVEPYRLPPLTVAILSLLGLVAFMLLMCLLSCLYSVHKRNEKNRRLEILAEQAGKGDGEAFRQVVHEAYTRFTEESLTQSVCDKPSECTEVTIKGLEVSKPGRYHTLSSDNLEMSDSGVEFNSSGFPLDSDTDAAVTYASHKPLLNAACPPAVTEGMTPDSPEATAIPDGDLSAIRTPDSVMSASPASNPRSLTAGTPDGSLQGAASPGGASRGTAESTKSEEGAAEEEGARKE